jgi:2-C-methyl-D-erythritol 4-phosphate cytidylyltransferase
MTSRLFGLIPAAGAGARLGGAHPKQYREIAGRALVYHAVRALLADARIDTAFVVLAADDARFGAIDWGVLAGRIAPLYCGGETRRDSVHNGLIAVSNVVDLEDWVLVHDAARPCLTAAELARLIDQGCDGDGRLLAIPVADTLKRADAQNRVVATEPREHLWQAQTPQLFRHGTLLRALDLARHLPAAEAALITDEASAVERLGLQPRLVLGSSTNLKVTYEADLSIAASLLSEG